MALAIERLRRRKGLDGAAVDRFLARHRFPIIEDSSATFVFRGEVDSVLLRHWIFGLPSTRKLRRVDGTDLWYHVEEVPPGSRVEYKFEIVENGRRALIRDPLNPLLARDPFGANSVCQGAGYERPEWTLPDPEARKGRIVDREIQSTALGEDRPVSVYLPARMRPTRRYPLLVVHDGFDFLRYADFDVVLDNLIHRLEIPSMIVAFTHSPARLREYAADEKHARFISRELVPELEAELPLLAEPGARCLLGASFGAVAALSTAWYYPGTYGRLLLQSGSFAFADIGESFRGPAFAPVVDFVNQFRAKPGKPVDKIFVSCGVYESLIYENRSLVPVLQRTGMEVRFVEARDGHNWENWRDRLREGLSWLFPGPLWMVYE